ncbi:hypothetical protein NP233_g10806 [Leucocoprinus birnbaumii]|uniref:Uncharacterized protein n=1 Tax=Leucocoprinus birnbaumii TaxID=56174 RepID=A0AAD5VLB2_9AGAR|nr:hypothetical protein NP233_g10806 [Leucocoprinus birnbaumii]
MQLRSGNIVAVQRPTRINRSPVVSNTNTGTRRSRSSASLFQLKQARKDRLLCQIKRVETETSPNARSHRSHIIKRRREVCLQGHRCPASKISQHILPSQPIKTNFTYFQAKEKISPAGYTIKPEVNPPKDTRTKYTPEDLINIGFKPIEWDGRTDKPIAMEDGRIFIVLLHAPDDEKYVRNAEKCFQQIRQLAPRAPYEGPHRRGDYPILNMGILHGGGTKRPVLLSHGSSDLFNLEKAILESPEIMKHAGHPSAGLDLWIPELGVLFRKTVRSIIENSDDILEPNFYNSSFPACTVNFGPQVVTDKHCDDQNYATAVCSVQSFGNYNYKKGGHLIFWSLRIFVEFPPNTAIIFPSALLQHSNTPIQKDEERASLVQYAPAELFRYVENGFMTDKEWNTKHSEDEIRSRNEERATNHVREGMTRFMTKAQLLAYRSN